MYCTRFQPGARVYVGSDAAAWAAVKQKGDTSLVLSGDGLKRRFPKRVPVSLRVVNPDGGEATALFTR